MDEFHALFTHLQAIIQEQTAVAFLQYLLEKTYYQKYLTDHFTNAEERWENVLELLNLAKKYDDIAPPQGIERLLEDVALMSDADSVNTRDETVNMMTLHAAKGLEFNTVFMVGMEEGILPHSRAIYTNADLEEERRLCYVGLTRARKKVFLTFAWQRTHFGSTQVNPPSRFLNEIPKHLLDERKSQTRDDDYTILFGE